MNNLEKDKLIEKEGSSGGKQFWTTTVKGNQLALASAAQPIKRETATQKINEFLERVEQANEESRVHL
ncbi:MAG: hypothetical protein U5K71_14855 [Gracilimonas sp.]|nr:hypothetical protein [Gracilimonas sp.]